jgi:hypothetical protein
LGSGSARLAADGLALLANLALVGLAHRARFAADGLALVANLALVRLAHLARLAADGLAFTIAIGVALLLLGGLIVEGLSVGLVAEVEVGG